MGEADQLTLEINTDAKAEVPTPQWGLLVTNHLNLMYMLATGLVMPPAGFGGEVLSGYPGVLPRLDPAVRRQGPRRRNRVFHTGGGTPQAGHRPDPAYRAVGPSRGDRARRHQGTAVPRRGRRNRVRAPGARAAPHVLDRVGFLPVGTRQARVREEREGPWQRASGGLQERREEEGAVRQSPEY